MSVPRKEETPLLEIRGLAARVAEKEILRGIDLVVRPGEVHAIMGPNGSGKSTLAGVLAGRPAFEVSAGSVLYQGKDLLALAPEARAREGIFLAFQYPAEIPGVTNNYFLKAALNALRQHRGQEPLDAMDFLALAKEKAKIVGMQPELMGRSVNEGFSGGEKKRNEVLQMLLLEPRLAILDETDSGLDIDALRVVASGVNHLRAANRALIVITHYQRLLEYIVPDFVHVLSEGRIARSGGKELAHELEAKGYGWLAQGAARARVGGVVSARERAQERLLALCGLPAGADALAALRRRGLEAFASGGLPDAHQEEWRYTSLAPLLEPRFERAPLRLEIASAPRGVELLALRDHPEAAGRLGALVDTKAHAFAALNTALLEDACLVRVPAGVVAAEPIHLVLSSGEAERATLSAPRLHIALERGARASVVQEHVSSGAGTHFTTAVTEIELAPGASLEWILIQREGDAALHASNLAVRIGRDAHFTSRVVTLGGRWVRNDLEARLAEEQGSCRLEGLYLGTGERLVDNHSVVDHAVPRCTSRQLYKGVLAGRSRGVFRGRVRVRPDAQKTDAQQSNANLLLGEGAEVDSKPQLEIHADDVKCSHGSAIGRLDPEALFYLRSRALSLREARALLTRGFAGQVLEGLPERLREPLAAELDQRLAAEEQP